MTAPIEDEDMRLPIAGTDARFDSCPAYYLRTADMGLPATHLLDGAIHPASVVADYALEVEAGARNVDTMSPRVRQLVHLFIKERRNRDAKDREMQREAA